MSYWAGTLLASPIVRGSSGDTYGTHHSILGVGGYMEVNSISERNALPVDTVNGLGYDEISSGQRRLGMLVYVYDNDTTYQLYINPSTWTGLTSTGKVNALSNNNNWKIYISGSDVSDSERIVSEFEQTTHGFVKGDVLAHDGTEFIKINNINAATYEPLGIVNEVIDVNNFKLTLSGYISISGIQDVNSSGLTGGTLYYLSDVDGKITDVKPTGSTNVNKPILVTLSGDTGIVLQYRWIYDNIGILNYDLFSGYTATTQQFLDTVVTGATNIGYFTGQTGIQTLPITHLTNSSYNGDYASLFNYYYRDVNGFIRIGESSDGNLRRGYVRTTPPARSWIWNEYTGDGAPNGWVFINADISSPDVYGFSGFTSEYDTPAYTAITWNDGASYNNGSDIIISTIQGSLLTGSTFLNGGPVFSDKQDQKLRLRTLTTETPESISIKHDDYFIRLSGTTSVSGALNIGDDIFTGGIGIFSGITGNTLLFKSLVGDGNTSITDNGDTITIALSGGSPLESFENVTLRVTQAGHGFSKGNIVGWSGGTYNKAIADGNYGGEVIGVVSTVINSNTFDVTQSGFISGMTGLNPDTTYYLSDTVFGGVRQSPPTTVGYIARPVYVARSSQSAWVLPYSGRTITAPVTGGTGGDQTYTGATPSNVTVGALLSGTTLTGRSISSILEEMLITTYFPTFTAPSNTFTDNASSTYEYGCVLDVDFTACFDRGSIDLQGNFQNYRSGDVNCYYYDGPGLPTGVSSTSLSDNQSITGYTISASSQTWNSCVGYDVGPQPLDSDSNPYCSPLPSGITSAESVSVSAIYPYYYGTVASGGAPAGSNRPTSDNDLITGGTKVLASSNGTLCINFNSTADDYLWFAIPTGSTSKTCWHINALNNGNIGGAVSPAGNLFPDFDGVSACSAQGCWCNVNYKVYVSNYQSEATSIMELRN